MRQVHVDCTVRVSKGNERPAKVGLSRLEKASLLTAVLLIVAAVIAIATTRSPGGIARMIGSVGLAALVVCAASRGVQRYRDGTTASLPEAVAKVRVRIGPARGFTLVSLMVAIGVPLAAIVVLLALIEWSWLLVALVLLVGCLGVLVTRAEDSEAESYYFPTPPAATALLERLCMRADMRAPELVVEADSVASAWTVSGRIHLSRRLVKLLDDAELEAVLAHEVAHLARRDAAAMEACSAPSRLLLMFAGALGRNLGKITRRFFWELPRTTIATWIVALLCIPPAFVIGWVSRLAVLGMSRAREFSADAAAAALTGRPSALASALLKLESQHEWAPASDLRQAYPADPVLCIVGTRRSGLGRLFSTHPATPARIRRLEEMEGRLQRQPARL